MRIDTPKDVPTHMLENPEKWITRVGKILRKTSLDELPQIINILKGEMSIIGPRPALWNQYDLIAERDKYGANDIRPGLTGYAQIHGRDELPIDVKAELDGYYVKNLCIWMDVKCFFGTIISVLRADGVVEGGTGRHGRLDKILFVATVDQHIKHFHYPYLEWFKNNGYEVHVASNGEEELLYVDKKYNVPFERSPFKFNNIKAYRQLKNIIEENNYKLVHCHTPVGSVITRLVSISARKKGLKVLYTAHGFHFYKGAPLQNWLIYYPIERYLSRFTDVLITINKEDYDIATKTFKAGKIEYVPGVGLDSRKYSDTVVDRLSKRKELGVPGDAFVILSVGELNGNKNHEIVIRALKELDDSNVYYLICGDGPLKNRLTTLAESLGVGHRVKLLGYRNDIPIMCKISDLFVFPSYREGLPVALMEAMCSGLPVICSMIRGCSDLVVDGKGGYLVDPGDINGFTKRIIELKNDPMRCLQMGKFNSQEVLKFDISNVRVCLSRIYEDLLNQ